MTMTLRRRAATVTLAAVTLLGGGVAVALPAQAASDPCAKYRVAAQRDDQRASDYYQQYRHASGAAKKKAYQEYEDYRTKSDQEMQEYAICENNR